VTITRTAQIREMDVDLGELAERIAAFSADGPDWQLEVAYFELLGVYGELNELADRLDEIEDSDEEATG
jgi:hypothetical protein